jgi:hypothetical protein
MTEWTDLVRRLPTMTEDELRAAMAKEAAGEARASYMVRMHARLCKLRAGRERRELLR